MENYPLIKYRVNRKIVIFKGFTTKKARSERYTADTIIDGDHDGVLLANTYAKAKSL